MNIRKSTWHARAYAWWRLRGEFKTGRDKPYQENLCHYVRVVVLWAPLWWLIVGKAKWWGWATLVTTFCGVASYLGTLSPSNALYCLTRTALAFGGLLGTAAVFAICTGIVLGVAWLIKRRPRDGFLDVIGGYIVARKRKICPFITFTDEEH